MAALRFRVFGIPLQILPGFWLLLLLIGVLIGRVSPSAVAIVCLIAFASLAVHELGHAWVARRYGFKPMVTLHLTGGMTTYAALRRVSRGQEILISAAGPLLGLLLSALALVALLSLGAPLPTAADGDASGAVLILWWVLELNVFWSLMNLIPVMPFDGGRILLAAFGEQRRNGAALVSLMLGLSVALVFVLLREPWPAVVFAAAAVISFRRLRQSNAADASTREAAQVALREAHHALRVQAFSRARLLAERVFLTSTQPEQRKSSVEVLLWALLGSREYGIARALVDAVDERDLDPYLRGAIAQATGDLEAAESVLQQALERGDARLEVSALLVRVLFEARRFKEAARVTLPISEQIPPDEARQVVREAERAGAHVEAARLSFRLAEQESTFPDARAAVLAFVRGGSTPEAAKAFQLALGLDHAQGRELLDDERLSAVRAELQAST